MKSLDEICNGHGADKGTTWHGYAPIYDKYFTPLRDNPIHFLEIGTQAFCSIKAWLEYFSCANIYGIDVWQGSPMPTDPRFKFFKGDQSDIEFLKAFKANVPKLDVVIDDAGHYPLQIRSCFDRLWPHIVPGGIYAIEDTHSFFHPQWTQEGAGQDWVRHLFTALNWNGKAFHGNPTPAPYTLTELESTLDRIEMVKGLILLFKK